MPSGTNYVLSLLEDVETQECANCLLALKNPTVTAQRDSKTDEMPAPKTADEETEFKNERRNSYDSLDSKDPSLLDEQSSHSSMLSDADIGSLLGDTRLVHIEDRRLVPDSIFIAMAQMKVCKLTESDKVGSYKNRTTGFIGMCCKHCGQRRSFPSTLRCLAQTTTSQTIVKHISSKCQYSPQDVCDKVRELQMLEAMESESTDMVVNGRRRYGSRKVFFQRIWDRLHNKPTDSPKEISSSEDESLTDAESASPNKRKLRFGTLPTKQNRKRRKIA